MPSPNLLTSQRPRQVTHWTGHCLRLKPLLKKGEMVTLIGFGTFYVGKRAARNGRNPRTGATIKIKAANSPKFRAGKALKDAVN